jgi:hypothetical protein
MAGYIDPRAAQAAAGFMVERQGDSGWSFVHAWVPTPPTKVHLSGLPTPDDEPFGGTLRMSPTSSSARLGSQPGEAQPPLCPVSTDACRGGQPGGTPPVHDARVQPCFSGTRRALGPRA